MTGGGPQPHPRSIFVVALVAASVGIATLGTANALAAVASPTVQVSPASGVALGQRVTVDLNGWPKGVVTVSVCGNASRRGTEDCDLPSSESTSTSPDKPAAVGLTVMRPPVDCPCVVRVSTSASKLVQLAPITISGIPDGANVGDASAFDANALAIRARVDTAGDSWPRSWFPPFGGPTDRLLVLVLTNRGTQPLTGLRVVGAVGRDRSSGVPISAPIPGALQPGERRTVKLPFTVEAPAWGSYVVTGTVFGAPVPVAFTVRTHNTPWALELMVPLLLLVAAQWLRRREARARISEPAAEPAVTAVELPQSSPLVGEADGGPWVAPSYDDGAVFIPQPRDRETQISLP